MEGMAMIMMTQMAQLMKKHIVLQDTRKTHYIQIEIDVSLSGTAAPIRCVMLDSHPVIEKIISIGKHQHTWRKFLFSLTSQSLDFVFRRHMDILELLFLLRYGLKNPFPTCLEEEHRSRIRDHIGHGNADSFERMHPDAHAAATGIPAECHSSDFRILKYFFCLHHITKGKGRK